MRTKSGLLVTAALALIVLVAGVWFVQQRYSEFVPSQPAGPESVVVNQDRSPARVSALGRIDPRNGVIRVAGPPRSSVVIQELRVDEGDRVGAGQIIAVLLGFEVQRAEVTRLEAELANAEWELSRNQALFERQTISESDLRAFECTCAH